jgi:hypothetical protein
MHEMNDMNPDLNFGYHSSFRPSASSVSNWIFRQGPLKLCLIFISYTVSAPGT